MDKEKALDITQSEWKVMQVLWKQSPKELGEIAKELEDTESWSKTTINTLLRRLVKKGAVDYIEARFYRYYPLVSEEECLKNEMTDMLNRLFYSSPKKLMATLVENENFSDHDLIELESLLEDIKKRGDKK